MAAALVLVAVAATASGGRWRRQGTSEPGLSWEAITHDGVVRSLAWYAGSSVGTDPVPVVLVLHGGGGSAEQVWSGDDGRAWRRLADERGLVLLLPEGRTDPGDPDGHHWNDCRTGILEPAAASTADDVGFLRTAVEWSASRFPVDPDRVFVTGASNGGMMSYRLAMEAPDMIAAAAAIIANLPDPNECPGPHRAMPILIMNGTADPLMPWEGGCIGRSGCDRGTVMSTAETVSFWIDVDRAETEPECRDLSDSDPGDGSTVTVCTYSEGVEGTEVVLYRIDGGGHSPPGPDPLPFWYALIVGPKNHDISAPDEIWAFFDRHRRITERVRTPEGRLR